MFCDEDGVVGNRDIQKGGRAESEAKSVSVESIEAVAKMNGVLTVY